MVMKAGPDAFLYPLLKSVSRSFYLTLAVLPSDVRAQLAVAYLFARAADSLADTSLVPRQQRLHYLTDFRRWLEAPSANGRGLRELQEALSPVGPQSPERMLLERLEDCRGVLESFTKQDQDMVRSVVHTLTAGMERDLLLFPGQDAQDLRALETLANLDSYIYYVAGCVGDFWTRMMCLHRIAFQGWDVEVMAAMGIRFGKGLQLTNVLRDLPRDLRHGRCYIPEALLNEAGLKPADLLDPYVLPRFKPVLVHLLRLALEHLDQGWLYTMAIPRREWRVRLACVWPILFAVQTLKRISCSAHLLEPGTAVKMTRREIYRDMALSVGVLPSRLMLTGYYGHLRKSVAC